MGSAHAVVSCPPESCAGTSTDAPVMGPPQKPSEAGFVGRGGARKRVQFSPQAETKPSGLCDDEGVRGCRRFGRAPPFGPKAIRAQPPAALCLLSVRTESRSPSGRNRESHPPVGAGPDDLENRLPGRDPAALSPPGAAGGAAPRRAAAERQKRLPFPPPCSIISCFTPSACDFSCGDGVHPTAWLHYMGCLHDSQSDL